MRGFKLTDSGDAIKVQISAANTHAWAMGHFDTGSWPCSELAGRRLMAEFDTNGLLDYTINGVRATERSILNIGADELNACISYFVGLELPKDHPCYFVVVGQFEGGK
jgi:hypothetical protein